MIKCVSIDGPDGAGKTTLISRLAEKYNTVILHQFHATGMVPTDPEERKNWFRRENGMDTTRLYLAGHRLRLASAREFKRGLHYKFLAKDDREKLILIDRGPLSVRAYTYAALKKDTNWSNDEIEEFIKKEYDFENPENEIVDLSILLFDKDSLNEVMGRRTYDIDDEMLIRYQYEYYSNHKFDERSVYIINPVKKQEDVLEETISIINKKVG